MKQGFYWHVHHDTLFEWCYDYDGRVECIKENKPKHEIETRLRLFQPIKSKLPKELVEALEKFDEARKKYIEAGDKYYKAWEKYVKARKKCNEARERYVKARKKCNEAREKYVKARKKYYEADEKYTEAEEKYLEALLKYKPLLEALHAQECGCREWNGKEVIFKWQRNEKTL